MLKKIAENFENPDTLVCTHTNVSFCFIHIFNYSSKYYHITLCTHSNAGSLWCCYVGFGLVGLWSHRYVFTISYSPVCYMLYIFTGILFPSLLKSGKLNQTWHGNNLDICSGLWVLQCICWQKECPRAICFHADSKCPHWVKAVCGGDRRRRIWKQASISMKALK